jgi:hypothetical protein
MLLKDREVRTMVRKALVAAGLVLSIGAASAADSWDGT